MQAVSGCGGGRGGVLFDAVCRLSLAVGGGSYSMLCAGYLWLWGVGKASCCGGTSGCGVLALGALAAAVAAPGSVAVV